MRASYSGWDFLPKSSCGSYSQKAMIFSPAVKFIIHIRISGGKTNPPLYFRVVQPACRRYRQPESRMEFPFLKKPGAWNRSRSFFVLSEMQVLQKEKSVRLSRSPY